MLVNFLKTSSCNGWCQFQIQYMITSTKRLELFQKIKNYFCKDGGFRKLNPQGKVRSDNMDFYSIKQTKCSDVRILSDGCIGARISTSTMFNILLNNTKVMFCPDTLKRPREGIESEVEIIGATNEDKHQKINDDVSEAKRQKAAPLEEQSSMDEALDHNTSNTDALDSESSKAEAPDPEQSKAEALDPDQPKAETLEPDQPRAEALNPDQPKDDAISNEPLKDGPLEDEQTENKPPKDEQPENKSTKDEELDYEQPKHEQDSDESSEDPSPNNDIDDFLNFIPK